MLNLLSRRKSEPSLHSDTDLPASRKSSTLPRMFDAVLATFGMRSRSTSFSSPSTSRSSLYSSSASLTVAGLQEKNAVTQFDYLMQDVPLSNEKVKYKLSGVRRRLDVELKVKSGTEKMTQAMRLEAENAKSKRLDEVEAKMKECANKVLLLQKSEIKYKSLLVDSPTTSNSAIGTTNISFANSTEDLPDLCESQSSLMSSSVKPLLTGTLSLHVGHSAGLATHSRKKPDYSLLVKVDGIIRASTRPTRTGRWSEDFSIQCDRAGDLEITVVEKVGGGVMASLWFGLWELEEALELRKAAQPGSGTGDSEVRADDFPGVMSSAAGNLEAVFELEPVGRVILGFNFAYQTRAKRAEGVIRRPNVQKVFPKRGHKFVIKQFYQVVKCAVCNDFLISGQGFQCSRIIIPFTPMLVCKYTCHKDCNSRVVIKCITKSEEKGDSPDNDLALLRHRIPHRFEPVSSRKANWCCHCGHMMQFGKNKGSLKCTECPVHAHKDCAHLVPNFCGLSSDMIIQMLNAIESAEKSRKSKVKAAAAAAAAAAPRSSTTSANVIHSGPMSDTFSVGSSSFSDAGVIVGGKGYRDSFAAIPAPVEVSDGAIKSSIPAVIPKNVGLNDFSFVAVLGKGNFGKVLLAEERWNRKMYAIKVLKKEFIIENDEVESTRSEKRVFLAANKERHPFLVNLHSCFQTESRIYFVMEYVSGGDLMYHIQRRYFTEAQARFYACEVLLALEYFHKNDILYRDLKLDNILLTLDGHIKIADYGLCKEKINAESVTNTFCGTPEFMAPEILREQPYGRGVDWWAFGILIYEMLLGQSPFRGDDEDEIFESILHDEILYPVSMTKSSVLLLQNNPEDRLGAGPRDAEGVKEHAYFGNVNWDDVYNKRIKPPFFPTVSSSTDVSNFDSEFTREAPVLTPCHSILSAVDQDQFKGFTHISKWAHLERSSTIESSRK